MSSPSDNASGSSGKRRGRTVLIVLVLLCAGLILADAVYQKHPHFAVETWFGFYGLYALAAGVAFLAAGRLFRLLLARSEDYYDRDR